MASKKALSSYTTRKTETPPTFAPNALQKRPGKVPNVASETLEKKIFWLPLG